MKRLAAVAGLVAALAFSAAGCANDPEDKGGNGGEAPKAGTVTLKQYPKAGDWEPVGTPAKYPAGAAELDIYAGEKISAQLRANLVDSFLVSQYAHRGWDKETDADGKPKKDLRRIRVEIYFHQAPVSAAKTFGEWRGGASINDVGEKAFADQDTIVFLRGSMVVRLVPMKFAARTAGEATIGVGKAIDAWLQGK